MFSWVKPLSGVLLVSVSVSTAASDLAEGIADIGRPATAAEIAAWDIDVRPDFKGLPAGSGTAEEGEELWLEKCAFCHGDFGDSNEVFSPLVLGSVTEDDMESGRVAALTDPAVVRTTLMKVSTLSTIWDYINRAMPWNAPKSLETDEVYALVAYLLSLGYVIEPDFELSNETIEDVQAIMPNRNGMTTDHGLWSVDGTPDVVGSDCVSNCAVDTTVTSSIPAYAMNAHGNLADQVRDYGPFPGIVTDPDAESSTDAEGSTDRVAAPASPTDLLASNGCSACHQQQGRLIGPSFAEIRARYAGQDQAGYLQQKIRQGGSGVWGSMAMPPMAQVDDAALEIIVSWLSE